MKQDWIQTEPERACAWLYWLKEIKLMMFSLDMLDCPMHSLSLSTWNFLSWMGWGYHSKSVLLFGFLCGTAPSCLKVVGWWWWVVGSGLQDFSVSPGSESTEPELLSLSHWAWVWAWLSLSAWAEPELDNKMRKNIYKMDYVATWRNN